MATRDQASRGGQHQQTGKVGANAGGRVDVLQLDYLQCTIPDIHGSPRGRVVPKHLIPRVLKDGFGLFQGVGNFGMNMEIPYDIKEYEDSHYANGTFLPQPDTTRQLCWSSTPQRTIGHVHCTLLDPKGQPDPVCSRATALRQLQRLENMGMTFKSSFEMEFMVFNDGGDPKRPLGGGKKQYANMELLDEDVDFFLDLMDTLRASGLPVEFFNNEYDEGQYEVTMEPRDGVEACDAVFLARYGIRAICRRRGYGATFMARPVYEQHANGFHLNHSLWTSDGRDVFFDAASPDRLSEFARHWVAGLLHHAPALCAIYCPTVNCYQRFGSGLAPDVVYWNLDDRLCSIRAKTSATGAYLENRLPSSACNPYLTLAATIAAGLDGVEKKLQCPQPGPPAEECKAGLRVPQTLGAALQKLKEDEVLREAVGTKVLDYFAIVKNFEIKHMENNTSTDMSKAAVVEAERKYYMPYL